MPPSIRVVAIMNELHRAAATATVMREQATARRASRLLSPLAPAAAQGSTTPVADEPESPSPEMLDQLRQAFADELELLADEARQAGLASASKDNAAKLQRLEGELQARLQKEADALRAELQQERARLVEYIEAVTTERQALVAQAEPVALEIAFTAVAKLLGQRAVERSVVQDLAAQAVAEHKLSMPLRIRVSPSDYEQLHALPEEGELAHHFRPDEHVQAGGCIIEMGHGRIDASLDVQLTTIKDLLLKSLTHGHAESA